MSLFGIESEDACREEFDTLLELHSRAKQAMSKEAIAVLKSKLKSYVIRQQGSRGQQMSKTEEQYFWPAVFQAYVRAPKLSSRKTWTEGLWEIEDSLNYHRPKKSAAAGGK